MFLLISMILAGGNVTFTPVRTLENPPEDQDLFLQNVLHMEIDTKGRILASDYPSARVYYWEADGSYAGYFGNQGQGPGEFSFAGSFGPPMGQIYAVEDRIYIYDSRPRTLSIFDVDYRFIRTITLEKLGGKINTFHVLEKNRFLFYDSYFCEDEACRRLLVYDGEGNLAETWRTVPDKTWARNASTERTDLFIFAPTLAVDFNRRRGEVAVAHTDSPVLEILDVGGKQKRSVKLEIPAQSVQQEDIDEFHEQDWMKGPESPKAIFPDEKSYFDWILSIAEGYLVYHLSPVEQIAEGYLVGYDGAVKGRFSLPCGEGGGMWSTRGRLFSATIDSAGDFALTEMKVTVD